jgi:hypothetical protein
VSIASVAAPTVASLVKPAQATFLMLGYFCAISARNPFSRLLLL